MLRFSFVLLCLVVAHAQQPEVIQFGVNPPNRLIVLIFNSPMDPSSCDVQALTFQSTPDINAGTSLVPTDGSCVSLDPADPVTVGIILNPQDWDMIESDPDLITSMDNTFISMTENFIQNTDGIFNLEIPSSEALQVTIFLSEQPTVPSTESAILDLNAEVLSLAFNQSIATINLGMLTIATSTGQFTLTGGGISLFNNDTRVNISLLTNDLNFLKIQLTSSQPPATLQLQSEAVISIASVGSVQQSLTLSLIPDTTSPVIQAFSLDMTSGTISLTFNEPVSNNASNLSAVFVTTSSQGVMYSLENAQITTNIPFVVFDVHLTSLTLNQLKNDTSIATSVQNTFLVAMQSSFRDLFGNAIVQSTVLQVTQFQADVVSPQLVSYTVDLNSGNLMLTFSEPIDSASVVATSMTITNSQQTQSLSLAGSSIALSSLNTILELGLPSMTLNEMKLLVSNGGNPLRLGINSSVAFDTSGNPVVPIVGIIPESTLLDMTPPRIVNFAAAPQPPSNLTIAMLFDEYLNVSTFNISTVTLTLASTLGSRSYSGLSGGNISSPNPQFVIYALSQSDMNQDKLVIYYQAAYFSGNLSVTFGSDLVMDLAGNPVTPRVSPLVYPSPQSDSGSPQLMGFDIDLINAELTMNFSESVFVLTPTGTITLQNTASAPSSSITLNSASYSSLVGSTGASITVPLDQVDRQAIISYAGLATDINNTYLQVSPSFAADYSGNNLISQAPVQASSIVAPPPPVLTVTGAEFDLDNGRLTLSFSSSVLFSSVNLAGLTLTNGTAQVTISAAVSVLPGSALNDTIAITLLNSDLNQLRLSGISMQWNVSVASGLVMSVNGALNQNQNIRLDNFTADTTPPLLVESNFDLNVGQLRLVFNEPVPVNTIIIAGIYISSTLPSAPQGINLAGSTLLTGTLAGTNTTLIFQLSVAIVNAIKVNMSIGTGLSDTFVFLSSGSVLDLYGTLLQPTGSQVTSYTPDSTQPQLIFLSMDLNTGALTMTFSEPVSLTTFNSSSVVITPNAPPGPVITSTPVLITGVSATLSNTILSASIADSLNEIKIVLTGQTSAYLVAPAGLVSDTSSNPSVNIFIMSSLIADTTPPMLVNVVPNQISPITLNNMSITFVFNEPVLLSSLDITIINMEVDAQGELSTFNHFSGGMWQTDVTSAVYFFSDNDLSVDNFAMRFLTGTYVTYVLVRVEGTLASDIAGNALLPPSNEFQHDGQGQTPPGPPSLNSFSLDLDAGLLQLSFSEPVVIQTIPNMVTIQNSDINPLQSFVLSSIQYSSQENLLGSSITLTLLPSDRDAIVNMGSLATSISNTYLLVQQSFAVDYEGNEIFSLAIQVNNLTLPIVVTSTAGPVPTSTVAGVSVTVSSTSILSSTIPVVSSTVTASSTSSSLSSSSSSTVLMASSTAAPIETSTAISSTMSPIETSTAISSTLSPIETSSAISSTIIAATTSMAPSEPSTTPMEPVATTTVTSAAPATSTISPSPTSTPSLIPMLTAATLDLNVGRLTMNFNIPITVASVIVTSVSFTNGGTSYSVTGSQGVTAVGGNGISVSLIKTDLDAVKFFLHSTAGTSWSVRLSQDTVTSVNGGTGNQPQTFALTSITPDTTPPSIVSFSLNLNSGRVVLTFSEPIDSNNYNLQQVFLNGSSSASSSGYTLQGSTVSTSFFSTIFNFVVSSATLNAMKLDSSVTTSSSNTFIFLTSESFRDVGGNSIAAITTTGLQVNTFTADSTSPQLSAFTLDLDSGLLSLTFSEAIQVSSFDAAGIRITNNAQQQAVVVNDFTMGSNTGATEVYLTLLSTLNDVKLLITSSGALQAYLSMTSAVAADTSDNAVVAIPNATPLVATSVTADTTAPQITNFVAGAPSTTTTLTFSFSEYVSTTSWNEASITLYLNTLLGDFTYSDLSAGTVSSSVSSTTTYTFSSSYFQGQFALRYQQAYHSGSIGLTFTSSLVRDVSNNMVLPQTSPLTYNSTTSDPVHPQLQSFSLDLNMGQLTMTFSESIEVREIAGNVRLQNSATSPSFIHTLVSSAYSSQQGTTGQVITLSLQQIDISGLNINENLASSVSDTFLFLASDFAVDFSANSLVAQTSAVQATSVIVFSGPVQPHVIAFDLDLDSNQLTFEFDTPVLASSFDPALVTLVNTSTISTQTTLIRLTNVTVIARDEQQRFRVLLSTADTVNVKRHPVCYTAANCYAVFDQGVVTSGTLPSAAVMTPLMVSNLLPDVTPPRFLSFPVFDLNSGFFTLIFSEPINGSSTDFTLVTFANSLSNPSETVKLTEGVTSPDHIEIDFHMPRNDLNTLKYRLNLCTNRDNCWIQLPSFFINDIGNNPFLHSNYLPNAQASYHQPTVFIADTTSPVLDTFDVDLNQGKLVLSFSEVVNDTLFSPGDVTFLNAPFGAIRLQLHNESEFDRINNGTAIEVTITLDDLNWLKSKNLFTTAETSYLSMQTDLSDVSGNVFVDIHHSNPQKVSNLTLDTTAPQITAFYYFNIDNGSFYIRFDEPVNSDSTDITRMMLTSGISSSSPSMRLTGGIARTLDSGRMEIEVQLSHEDRVTIKLISGLATAQTNTWIMLDASTIRDTGGNNNTALSSPLPLSSGGFVPDTTTASLLSVSLDMNQEILRMLFSDVIDASSITQTLLRIQNNGSTADRFLNLTSTSQPWTTSSDAVEIFISLADLNNLKRDLNLTTDISNTFFSLSGLFARDVENRFVDSVPFSNAQRAANYTRDTTNPLLLSYKLDMDSGVLYFTFNEPILIDINPSAVTLFNSPTPSTDQYQLSGGTASPMIAGAPADTLMSLQLSYNDLNTIKGKTSLATTIMNLYLSFTANFVQDTSNVPVVAVTSLSAASYEPDTTLPELEYFDTDLTNGGTITMKFSEAVHFTNTIQSTIRLQNSVTGAGIQFGLDATETAAIASSLKDTINITLSSTHTSRLLNDQLIGSSTSNLYLSIIAGGVYDYSDGSVGLGQSIAPTTKRVRNIHRTCYDINQYNNITQGRCVACASECVHGCTGDSSRAEQGGCNLCGVIVLDRNGSQVGCLELNRACPSGHYTTSNSQHSRLSPGGYICLPCDVSCTVCTGPQPNECQACQTAFTQTTAGTLVECRTNCGNATAGSCQFCHLQCDGCSGPTNRDCVNCRGATVTNAQGTICIPSCSDNEYLADFNGEYLCLPCHSQCNGCTGSTSMDCKQCQSFNSTLSDRGDCVTSCPSNTYTDSVSQCLACHSQCVGCDGPSNRNCITCAETVTVTGGSPLCIPTCPIWQEFDLEQNFCSLAQSAVITIVVVSIIGAIVLIVLIIITTLICWIRRRKGSLSKNSWANSSEPTFVKSTSL